MARNRPKLLPEKLRVVREHLNLDPPQMAERLMSQIESHTKERIEIKLHWVPNFERGKHEPDLITVLGYSLLVNIPMDQFIDDAVSTDAFREKLPEKELNHKKRVGQHTKR